jgi:hypothetical protein
MSHFLYQGFTLATLSFSGNVPEFIEILQIWAKGLFTNFARCLTTNSGISSYPAENLSLNYFITQSTSFSVIGNTNIELGQYSIFD